MLTAEEKKKQVFQDRGAVPYRLILTGFRGTGKSYVGKRLAELLGYGFVDTDEALCFELQCTLADFVSNKGWPAFRESERKLLGRLAGVRDLVVATGGGSIMHQEEWGELRENSLVIWLQADAETIRKRIEQDSSSASQRPSLTGSGTLEEIAEILSAREPLYRNGSDAAVDTVSLSREEVVEQIKEIISGGAGRDKV